MSTEDIVKLQGTDSKRKDDDVWSSRWAFYFAAVGAAVGFGNVWRFPALMVQYGGGAFFVPYFLAFALIGIPILVLEIGFGQYWQTGDVGVFGSFHRRFASVGVSSVACGFILVTYYSMLIAWVLNAFFDSFGDNQGPWAEEGVNGGIAISYFIDEIIGRKTLGDDGRATRLVWANVGYSAMAWFIIFVCLAFGTKITGQITYFTMGIPVIVLFVFLGKSLTLEGASDGIEVYIGKWDMSSLRVQGDVWSSAVTQIFFSIGITFGTMTAFGSHLRRHEPAFLNSVVIASSNSMFSIISGFAVFAALGHLAFKAGVEVEDLDYGGFSLVFGTWPVVLGTLPGGIHWVRLLFFDLFLLGIDSGFAILEGVITVAGDCVQFKDTPKWKVVGVWSLLGFLCSLLYATDAGLDWLDVIDYYINFVLTFVGILETFGAGWIYGHTKQCEKLGSKAVYAWMATNFFPVIVACCLWFGMEKREVLAGFMAWIFFAAVGTAITHYFVMQKMAENPGKWTVKSFWWDLSFGNIFKLKHIIESTIQPIPDIWAFLIKGFIPHVLIILFVNAAATRTDADEPKFGGYGGYSFRPYQIMGILCVVFAAFLFIIGFIYPDVYKALEMPKSEIHLEFEKLEAKYEGEKVVEEEDDAKVEEVEDEQEAEEHHKGKVAIPDTTNVAEGSASRNIQRKQDHDPHRKEKKQHGGAGGKGKWNEVDDGSMP